MKKFIFIILLLQGICFNAIAQTNGCKLPLFRTVTNQTAKIII